MNIAQLARKFGQVISPVRISVSEVSEILGEPARSAPQDGSPWVASARRSASGHMLDLEFVERTDVGRVRDHNEDYLGYASPATPAQVRTHGWMFVLADGVGGHEKGEVASKTAVESIVAGFHNAKDGESHSAVLQRLLQQANTSVFEAAVTGGRSSAGMATTVVACALGEKREALARGGGARWLLTRNGK